VSITSPIRSVTPIPAAAVLLTLALMALIGPRPALADGAVVWRDHGNTAGEADEPNICGWPSHFDGHITFSVVAVESPDGTSHLTFHLTDNWTLVIADDPSVPASVRGDTWRGRSEMTQVVNLDASTQRVVQIFINPFAEGPFQGLVERVTFVVDPSGNVRVDRREFLGEIDCSQFA
jgi:hypothetical protein